MIRGEPKASAIPDVRPACRECQAPVRVENTWHLDEDGRWRLRATMVCPNRHRAIVEPF